MRSTLPILATVLLLGLHAPAGQAQQRPLSELPGYFPFEELDILTRDELSVEINLSKPLLRLVAAATRKAEPEFAALIDSLDAVRVRVAPAEDVDLARARRATAGAADWLEDKGWQVVMRTRENDEETFIYTRELEGEIAGMAILAIEGGGDVAVINIVGRMDLAQLERLGEALDLPLVDIPSLGETSPEPEPQKQELQPDEDPDP